MMTSVMNCRPAHCAPEAIEQRFHPMRTASETAGAFSEWIMFWENEERLSHRQGEARFGQE